MSRSLTVLAVAALTTTFFAGPALAATGDVDGDGTAAGDCAPLNPAIHPGAADPPDLGFVDSNCDGIDGTEADAIFVTLGGDNAATGTRANPMRTVSAAVSAASAAGADVYVAGGTFTEPGGVPLADGVGIYGGYTPGTGVRSLAETTKIQGQTSPAAVAFGDEGVVLQQLDLVGVPDGSGNSYGLRVVNDGATPSKVLLEGVDVTAQAAGPAVHGSAGSVGATGFGFLGGTGGSGGCGSGVLGQLGLGGGPVGAPGGSGGNTTPSLPDAATWARGTAGSGGSGGPGAGGAGGRGGTGTLGLFGTTLCGGQGGTGGTGGGGGTGGSGGRTGAGSFAAYVVSSSLVALTSTLTAGAGGPGGNGGDGGSGGNGTAGSFGFAGGCDIFSICAGSGAPGAPGAAGGRGGAGGAGAGGPSAGVYQAGATSGYTGVGSTETAGAGGLGGFPGNGGSVRAASGASGAVLRTTSAPVTSGSDFDADGVTDPGDACPGRSGGPADADADGCPEPPETTIGSGPPEGTFATSTSAAFGLGSSEPGSTFTCSLDGATGARCTSPRSLSGLAARTHTLAVWARDGGGDVDPSAATRTWTVPRNNTALGHSSGWTKATGSGYFLNTYSTTTRKGAALSTAVSGGRKIALVATKGPGHGTVKVLLGSTVLKTVSLAATRLSKRQVLAVATFPSARSGTLKVVVATSGKPVRIEGLGVATR